MSMCFSFRSLAQDEPTTDISVESTNAFILQYYRRMRPETVRETGQTVFDAGGNSRIEVEITGEHSRLWQSWFSFCQVVADQVGNMTKDMSKLEASNIEEVRFKIFSWLNERMRVPTGCNNWTKDFELNRDAL